jgi:hypothetical protein
VLNDNLDNQDGTIHDAFLNMAPPFSESSTYAVDDIVLYTTGLYKCHTAVVTPGSWTGSTNWQVYKLSEGGSGGGGGTSDYNPLTNKPQINGVTLIGNKTTNDLGITASGVGAIPSTDKGANGGVAELDSNGKVPSSQLPSYVDDVLSYASQSAFPATGETGKIYIAEDTNKTYRWSGSAYAEISASLALGETSSTAYRGDRGKTAYDHSQTTGNPHGTTKSDVGLSNVPNVSTNNQTPTFSQASTRNNIASGEKLSVIFGKVQKFFNDLKTVAFTGSFSDLSNKPENSNTFQGTIAEWNQLTTAEKKAYDHASIPDSIDGGVTFPANKVVMTGGGSVENALGNYKVIKSIIADGIKTYQQILNELYSYSDDGMILMISSARHYQLNKKQYFNVMENGDGVFKLNSIVLNANNSTYYRQPWGSTVSNYTNSVVTQGFEIKLIKYY